jgi:hypothetical protein
LGLSKPLTVDKVTFYATIHEEDGKTITNIVIVDDKNIEGDTLGLRRVSLLRDGVRMRRLSKAIFFLGDMIKLATSKTWFIDNNGMVFNYKKTQSAKLNFKRISKVIPISTGGALLELEGSTARYKSLYAPTPQEKYAGILTIGAMSILYGVYDTKYDNTTRRI